MSHTRVSHDRVLERKPVHQVDDAAPHTLFHVEEGGEAGRRGNAGLCDQILRRISPALTPSDGSRRPSGAPARVGTDESSQRVAATCLRETASTQPTWVRVGVDENARDEAEETDPAVETAVAQNAALRGVCL